MSHTFTIDPEARLVVIRYQGEVTLAEMNQMAEKMLTHPDYQETFNGVSDYRDAYTHMTVDEFYSLIDAAIEHDAAKGKWCLLSTTPNETGFSYLYKDKLKVLHDTGVFSTLQAGSDFLNTDLSRYLPSDL